MRHNYIRNLLVAPQKMQYTFNDVKNLLAYATKMLSNRKRKF